MESSSSLSSSSSSMSTTTTFGGVINNYSNKKKMNDANIIICSVNDYQTIARQILPKAYYEYIASGTDDEQTLYENRAAYKRWFLYPKCCRNVSTIDTTCHIRFPNVASRYQNQIFTLPLFVSPAGVHGIASSSQQQDNSIGGELASSAACKSQGILFGLSQHSTTSIEDSTT